MECMVTGESRYRIEEKNRGKKIFYLYCLNSMLN